MNMFHRAASGSTASVSGPAIQKMPNIASTKPGMKTKV
jgi:hypothetical protein